MWGGSSTTTAGATTSPAFFIRQGTPRPQIPINPKVNTCYFRPITLNEFSLTILPLFEGLFKNNHILAICQACKTLKHGLRALGIEYVSYCERDTEFETLKTTKDRKKYLEQVDKEEEALKKIIAEREQMAKDQGIEVDENFTWDQINKNHPMKLQKKAYYALLHLSEDAPTSVVKAAYKALARQMHPDISPDHADQFQEITNAYNEILKMAHIKDFLNIKQLVARCDDRS